MLPSESIEKIIHEYDDILVRDLGFADWKIWKPMIEKISEVLGVTSLKGVSLTEAHKNPGESIALALIKGWTLDKQKYLPRLVSIKKFTYYTPHHDRIEYKIHIKSWEEFLEELTKIEIYRNIEELKALFNSLDYKTLRKLHGTNIIIDR